MWQFDLLVLPLWYQSQPTKLLCNGIVCTESLIFQQNSQYSLLLTSQYLVVECKRGFHDIVVSKSCKIVAMKKEWEAQRVESTLYCFISTIISTK